MSKDPTAREGVVCRVDEFCSHSEHWVSHLDVAARGGNRPVSPAKVKLITRAYRLDLFLAGSLEIIHMKSTAAVAALDKKLQINVGIVIAGCQGMVAVQTACNSRGANSNDQAMR